MPQLWTAQTNTLSTWPAEHHRFLHSASVPNCQRPTHVALLCARPRSLRCPAVAAECLSDLICPRCLSDRDSRAFDALRHLAAELNMSLEIPKCVSSSCPVCQVRAFRAPKC